MSNWLELPSPPLLAARTVPYLVAGAQLAELRDYFDSHGAHRHEADIANATNTIDAVNALKTVLPFPTWCGSSWDSIDDAFEEIRGGLEFPFALILHGLPRLLNDHRHLALEVVVRTAELQEAFSRAGDQFLVVFAGPAWT